VSILQRMVKLEAKPRAANQRRVFRATVKSREPLGDSSPQDRRLVYALIIEAKDDNYSGSSRASFYQSLFFILLFLVSALYVSHPTLEPLQVFLQVDLCFQSWPWESILAIHVQPPPQRSWQNKNSHLPNIILLIPSS
jgi:hypothetical protein